MTIDRESKYGGLIHLIEQSKEHYNRGLVLAFEGVEATGKTSTCQYLHKCFCEEEIKSILLTNYYERTDHTGPLIASITENPCVIVEHNMTSFLLYCARLSDKIYAAYKLSQEYDLVLMDRIDLTLAVRAIVGWDLERSFVNPLLHHICGVFHNTPYSLMIQCLDTDDSVRWQRSKGKNTFRRRYIVDNEKFDAMRQYTLEMAGERSIDIIDTSHITHRGVLTQLNSNAKKRSEMQ